MNGLPSTPTRQEIRVLLCIRRHQRAAGWVPTQREIAATLQISRARARQLIEGLRDRGLLRHVGGSELGRHRNAIPTLAGRELADQIDAERQLVFGWAGVR